jgi:hypothetical protein
MPACQMSLFCQGFLREVPGVERSASCLGRQGSLPQRRGQKTVPFILILDADFDAWFMKVLHSFV